MMHELISSRFGPAFGIEGTSDSAVVPMPSGGRLAVTTDSYVVSPLFFPGGNIGDLAVNGTVNDLAVSGARPLYLTAGFVIEEGFLLSDLEKIIATMAEAARVAGVRIIAGDTKVVDKGKGDGVFINTAGVGVVPEGVELGPSCVRPGDRIIISGSLGRHGVAVMGERAGLSFTPPVVSDTAPLAELAAMLLAEAPGKVRIMRDPTRGGLATTLKEFALATGLCMQIEEGLLPVEPGVRGACDLLGLDPLYVANEGLLVALAAPDVSDYLVERMRLIGGAEGSAVIGEVAGAPASAVRMVTAIGGSRLVDMLQGGQLPRIC